MKHLLFLTLLVGNTALAQSLTLDETLSAAESMSPSVKQKRLLEQAAGESVGVEESREKPRVDLQAIDSYGFPGTTGYLGAGGIMGSPYRSGWAVGLVAQQTLLDFGEAKSRVAASEQEVQTKKLETAIERQNVKIAALTNFYDCERLATLRDLYEGLLKQTRGISEEVKGFVKTGQRSVVDRYLADAQVEDIITARDEQLARLKQSEQALSLLVGKPSVSCSYLPEVNPSQPGAETFDTHPYIEVVKSEAKAEGKRKEMVKRQLLPKVSALVTVGDMEKARLVDEKNYAVGLAISMPLYDGSARDHEISRSDALIASYQAQAESRRLELQRSDLKLSEERAAAEARLFHAQKRIKDSKKAFALAKERYTNSEGSLTDLREASSLLARDQTALIDAKAKYLIARGIQDLVRTSSPSK